ncbi:MAG: M20/M25/M40 family metallo-hydrolase [bacterium]|nr:M20/M25/M40 family metallo-hydrolase [bacterium]
MRPRSILQASAVLLLLTAPGARAFQSAGVPPFSADHERTVDRIVEIATEDSQVATWLLTLTKAIGPRLTGSPGLDRAYDWSLSTFKNFGLDAQLETYDEWELGFERGPSYGRVIALESVEEEPDAGSGPDDGSDSDASADEDPDDDESDVDLSELVFMTSAWSRGTDGPLRGRAVLTPRSFEELEAASPDLAGAWLVDGPRRRIEDRAERRRFSDELAAAMEENPSAGRIAVSRTGELLKMGGRPPKSIEDAQKRSLRITLVAEQHKALVARLQDGEQLDLEFDIDNRFVPGPRPLRNVVADLVGTEYPNEYVIVQSHLDSWDLAEGAADNGTGCATTIEAARLLVASGAKPKRTIRFILYSGEEQGLYGSKGYVRDHADELEAISMVLNHDHGTNHLKGILSTEFMRPQLERVFERVMRLDEERPFELIDVDNFPRSGSSDHASFVQAGVPAIHWAQDEDGYFFIHHTQNDTFENTDQAEQRHSSMVIAIAAFGLADLDHLVDRTDLIVPPDRKMGVSLNRTRIASVTPGGFAAEAGWQEGDQILEIDGIEVKSRKQVVDTVQAGGADKLFVMQRGEERLEVRLDWSDDPNEAARTRYRARKEAKAAEKAKEEKKEGKKEPEKAGAAGG